MSRADELRRQADLIERMDELSAEMERALAAHRADVDDPELKADYRAAVAALQEARAAERSDRAGLSVTADSVRLDEGV